MPGVWTPTAKSNAHQLAHPHDNRQTLCLAIVILMLVIDILATAIRLACRRKLKARLSYDDYAIIIATVGCIALSAITVEGIHLGLGKHTIYAGYHNVRKYMKFQFAFELIHPFIFTSVKISILLFYRRVFPSGATTPRFQLLLNLTILTCILWWFIITVVVIFECTPVAYAWNQVYVEEQGHCINWPAALFAAAVTNIIVDIMLLTLPISNVWRMQIRKEQKLAISSIFLLGGLVVLVSIVRCTSLMELINPDILYVVVSPSLWSISEISTAMICANALVMGPIIRSFFPRWIYRARSLVPLPTSRFLRTRKTPRPGVTTFQHLDSNDQTTAIDVERQQKRSELVPPLIEASQQTSTSEGDLEKSIQKVMEAHMS